MSSIDRSRATAFGSIQENLRDESGAFPIEPGRISDAVLPPLGATAETGGAITLDGALDGALEGIDELPAASVSMIPEPPPAALTKSKRPPEAERAQLVLEDLSLRPDNPYNASSLVPPPEKPFAYRTAALVAGAMLFACAVGGLTQWTIMARGVESRPSARVHAPKPVAKVAAAPKVAPAAVVPAAVAAPTPEVPTAVVAQSAPVAAVVAAAKPAEKVVAEPKVAATEPRPVAPVPAVSELSAPSEPPAAALNQAPVQAQEPDVVAPAVVAADLPLIPTREQVTAGFDSVRAAVEQCAAGQHGLVTINVSIANTGRVAQALVEGSFRGTPAGSCIARAVRNARFPAFTQPRLSVSYPLSL